MKKGDLKVLPETTDSQSSKPSSIQFENPVKNASQVCRLMDSGELLNSCSVGLEKQKRHLAAVIQFSKETSLLSRKVGYKKDDLFFIFGFERVDHPLEFATGDSTRIMNLNHHVLPLSYQGKVLVFTGTFPPDPARDNHYQHAG